MIAIPRIGLAGAFYINAISFLAVIAGLLMMNHTPPRVPVRSQSGARYRRGVELRPHQLDGLHAHAHGQHHQHLRYVYATMLPIMAKDVLKVGASDRG